MLNKVAVAYVDAVDVDKAKKIAQKWQLDYIGDIAAVKNHPELLFALQVNLQRLELSKLDEPKLGAICVDFVDGATAHRRKFGGGRGQDLPKPLA